MTCCENGEILGRSSPKPCGPAAAVAASPAAPRPQPTEPVATAAAAPWRAKRMDALPLSPWECRVAQSRQDCPEEAQQPSSGTAKRVAQPPLPAHLSVAAAAAAVVAAAATVAAAAVVAVAAPQEPPPCAPAHAAR
eukprot:scaffold11460_cov64-Phaeocystis_antarctica.AAC.9